VSSPEAALRRCWHGLGGVDDAPLDELLAHHREPLRRYHTAVHVMWVLRHVDELLADPVADDVDAPVVRAAALFHDAVYDPRSPANEADSAAVATRALTPLGWAPARLARVAQLIEATAGHDAAVTVGHADAAVLFDADLAILGSSPAEYQAYVTGVRAEYRHVDDVAWRTGRAAVLRGLLARQPIYATTTMRAARERRARANMAAELAALDQ
jgi:predicted metal-dependent HD superfamily phosphohydrolase